MARFTTVRFPPGTVMVEVNSWAEHVLGKDERIVKVQFNVAKFMKWAQDHRVDWRNVDWYEELGMQRALENWGVDPDEL